MLTLLYCRQKNGELNALLEKVCYAKILLLSIALLLSEKKEKSFF